MTLRVVVDTNVVISGLLNGEGPPARVLDLIRNAHVILLVDARILDEYRSVLARPKFQRAIRRDQAAAGPLWNQSTEELLLDGRDYPHLTPTGDVPVCGVISTPANGASAAQRVMAAVIAGSRRALYISNAYFVPTPSFIDALCAASDRGVDVHVLVPGPHHDQKIVRRASRHSWPRLVGHGVSIHEYQPTMMHAKTVVADGELVLVGSINFDPRSFALNAEFGVVIVSRRLAADAVRTFEADIKRSIRVLPATIATRGVANRAVDALCYWARAQL